ncbi:iron complex outermembrane receptor protein [Bradyrhizobium sp. AZCC 1588]
MGVAGMVGVADAWVRGTEAAPISVVSCATHRSGGLSHQVWRASRLTLLASVGAVYATLAHGQTPTSPDKPSVLLEAITVAAPPRSVTAPRRRMAVPRVPSASAPSSSVTPASETSPQAANASLNPPPFQAQQERFIRRPGAETVVSVTQQDKGNQANLREVLEQTPGVYITDRGENSLGTISMRGSDSSQTGPRSGRGVRGYMDGVPIGRIESGITQPFFDTKAIDYIEVYRGANSLRYGALATGGAINAVSKTGLTAPGVALSGSGGSYGNAFGQFEVGGAKGQFDYYGQVNQYRNDGYQFHSRSESTKASGNFGWRPSENVENRTFVSFSKSEQQLPTSVPLKQLDTYRRSGYDPTNASFPFNLRADYDYQRVVNKTVIRAGDTAYEIAPYFMASQFDHLPSPRAGIVDVKWQDSGISLRAERKTEIAGLPTELVAGFRPTYETARYRDWQWAAGSAGNQKSKLVYNDSFRSWLTEGFSEAAIEIVPRVRLFAGAQVFWTNRIFRDEYSGPVVPSGGLLGPASSNGRRNYDREFSALNPKLGVNWEHTRDHFWFANISRSTEVPNSGDIFSLLGIEQAVNGLNNPAVQLNLTQDLRMQRAWTAETGIRGGWERFGYDITLYHMRLRDEILSQCALGLIPLNRLTPGQRAQMNGQFACSQSGNLVAYNADRTIHSGIETGFKTRPFVDVFTHRDHIFLNAIWNYTDFRFDNDPVFGSNRLPVLPTHQLFGELGYRHPSGFYASGNIRYVGERQVTFDGSGGDAFVVPAYALYGIKAGWKAPDNSWTLWFEGRNLTNVAYVGDFVPLLKSSDAASGTPSVYPGTGRAFYAGFTKRFN